MTTLFTLENAIALLTLTALEIVLGIDNIVFLSIMTAKLPAVERPRARRVGLAGAMLMRIGLLLALTWVMTLVTPLFTVLEHEVTGRDLILLAGGLFLIAKATREIHDKLESSAHDQGGRAPASFGAVIAQVMVLDIVFSLDSVITAVGMAQRIEIMIAAIVVAVGIMLAFAHKVSDFVERHPTVKMLALAFLILIGVVLVADGMGRHIEKGYIYFAMAFALLVELLNLKLRGRNGSSVTAAATAKEERRTR